MAKRTVREKASKRKAAKKVVKKAAARKPKRAAPKRTAVKREAARPAPGGVVHWEIHARDQAMQQQFYRELFGWRIDDANPMGYGVVSSAGAGAIGGGFGRAQEGGAAGVMFYVGVPSIEEALAKVTALGAQPIMPRTDLGMVIMAQFRDLEGNLIGLVEG